MTKGIYNPYKPKEIAQPISTDGETARISSVKLDGDSFVIEFQNTKIDEVAEKLVGLIHEICKDPDNANYIKEQGINYVSLDTNYVCSTSEICLPVKTGSLYVYVGENGNEVDAFRRIGYTLHKLPIQEILKKYKVRIVARA